MTSAAKTTVHSCRRRATSGMASRTVNVAAAKLDITMPMVEADSPSWLP